MRVLKHRSITFMYSERNGEGGDETPVSRMYDGAYHVPWFLVATCDFL
jgi:hypothetical protein